MTHNTLHGRTLGYWLNSAIIALIVTLANIDAYIINTRHMFNSITNDLWQDATY